MAGLTIPKIDADGLVVLTDDQVRENLRYRTETSGDLGPNVDTGIDCLYGILIDVAAAEIGELYGLAQAIYDFLNYDNAEGAPLDNLLALRGTIRQPKQYSTAPVQLTGTPGTPIPAGSKAAIPQGGEQWELDADVVIGGGGTVDTTVTALNHGPIVAALGAISEIIDGVSGWTGITNTAKAEPGDYVESDTDARIRGDSAGTGSTTESATFLRLSELDYIFAAVVSSNRTDSTDTNGTPPHTTWIVLDPIISDPDELQEIAETIWGVAGTAPGIGMRGAVTAEVIGANGTGPYTIAWDWRTLLDVYSRVDYMKDATFPGDGPTLIRTALLAWGSTLQIGQDLNPASADAAIYAAVPGVTWVATSFRVGATPTYPTYNVPLATAINERGQLNDGEVTILDVTP